MENGRLPMNLQFFAEKDTGTEPEGAAQGGEPGGSGSPAGQIDYEKIQKMLDGTLAAKEDAALKNYFAQQGLSQEDAEKAMAAFRAEKAKNTPDTLALQNQIAQEKAAAQSARVESTAILTAVSLGLDEKTIPYVLKMADLSAVTDKEGKINEEAVKTAINKVLEDVPQLKPSGQESSGFRIGGSSGQQPSGTSKAGTTTQIPTKRWNRFNN